MQYTAKTWPEEARNRAIHVKRPFNFKTPLDFKDALELTGQLLELVQTLCAKPKKKVIRHAKNLLRRGARAWEIVVHDDQTPMECLVRHIISLQKSEDEIPDQIRVLFYLFLDFDGTLFGINYRDPTLFVDLVKTRKITTWNDILDKNRLPVERALQLGQANPLVTKTTEAITILREYFSSRPKWSIRQKRSRSDEFGECPTYVKRGRPLKKRKMWDIYSNETPEKFAELLNYEIVNNRLTDQDKEQLQWIGFDATYRGYGKRLEAILEAIHPDQIKNKRSNFSGLYQAIGSRKLSILQRYIDHNVTIPDNMVQQLVSYPMWMVRRAKRSAGVVQIEVFKKGLWSNKAAQERTNRDERKDMKLLEMIRPSLRLSPENGDAAWLAAKHANTSVLRYALEKDPMHQHTATYEGKSVLQLIYAVKETNQVTYNRLCQLWCTAAQATHPVDAKICETTNQTRMEIASKENMWDVVQYLHRLGAKSSSEETKGHLDRYWNRKYVTSEKDTTIQHIRDLILAWLRGNTRALHDIHTQWVPTADDCPFKITSYDSDMPSITYVVTNSPDAILWNSLTFDQQLQLLRDFQAPVLNINGREMNGCEVALGSATNGGQPFGSVLQHTLTVDPNQLVQKHWIRFRNLTLAEAVETYYHDAETKTFIERIIAGTNPEATIGIDQTFMIHNSVPLTRIMMAIINKDDALVQLLTRQGAAPPPTGGVWRFWHPIQATKDPEPPLCPMVSADYTFPRQLDYFLEDMQHAEEDEYLHRY